MLDEIAFHPHFPRLVAAGRIFVKMKTKLEVKIDSSLTDTIAVQSDGVYCFVKLIGILI